MRLERMTFSPGALPDDWLAGGQQVGVCASSGHANSRWPIAACPSVCPFLSLSPGAQTTLLRATYCLWRRVGLECANSNCACAAARASKACCTLCSCAAGSFFRPLKLSNNNTDQLARPPARRPILGRRQKSSSQRLLNIQSAPFGRLDGRRAPCACTRPDSSRLQPARNLLPGRSNGKGPRLGQNKLDCHRLYINKYIYMNAGAVEREKEAKEEERRQRQRQRQGRRSVALGQDGSGGENPQHDFHHIELAARKLGRLCELRLWLCAARVRSSSRSLV